jgi:hypothetical protein
MSTIWVISMVIQWAVIGVLGVVVLSLVRQLGLIGMRLDDFDRPVSVPGPAIGTTPPAYAVPLATGDAAFPLAGRRPKPQLLVFLSPDCGACEGIPAALHELDPRAADVLVALSVERADAAEYLAGGKLDGLNVALLDDIPGPYYVTVTPMAFALSADGVVAGRGHPRDRADLEDLLAVARRDAVPVIEVGAP